MAHPYRAGLHGEYRDKDFQPVPGNALAYHAAYEFGGDVTALPGGRAWLDAVNQAPDRERLRTKHLDSQTADADSGLVSHC